MNSSLLSSCSFSHCIFNLILSLRYSRNAESGYLSVFDHRLGTGREAHGSRQVFGSGILASFSCIIITYAHKLEPCCLLPEHQDAMFSSFGLSLICHHVSLHTAPCTNYSQKGYSVSLTPASALLWADEFKVAYTVYIALGFGLFYAISHSNNQMDLFKLISQLGQGDISVTITNIQYVILKNHSHIEMHQFKSS